MSRSSWLAFTDLDGTLLDHATYDWRPATAALAALERAGCPLVLASSKTRAEIEAWRGRLKNHAPFISENGGALFVPHGATPRRPDGAVDRGPYLVVEFGVPYERLREGLRSLASAVGVGLRGFGDMSEADVAGFTGLSGPDLQQSMKREYDEPFVPVRPLDPGAWAALGEAATALGLRVTRGGRFGHLIGPNSKGRAARCLITAYTQAGLRPRTLAAGDGANDLELLVEVDHPIVVARPDGTHTAELTRGLPEAVLTRQPGPAGFAEGVLHVLGDRP